MFHLAREITFQSDSINSILKMKLTVTILRRGFYRISAVNLNSFLNGNIKKWSNSFGKLCTFVDTFLFRSVKNNILNVNAYVTPGMTL